MNPVRPYAPLQDEPVPLQDTPHHMYPGQLHGPEAAGGQHTIVLQSEPPRDHIIWSLFCFFYSNPFCLGLAALVFSIKSRDRKIVGDLEGARHYGSTARCLNIAATIIACITAVILIAVYGVLASL
ncbi:dispanin subfamily A member 2b isoform X2 [Oryzias melastigma]|uniref:Dispanin subfamily A member 2b-like n=1 Tax=Oryzias melastigma TaxID=30732 RepID=A0A3B3C528_ORYME|nr:dispanin subfamily A member 2b isoform X2 [Oryzias melastigma]